MSGIDPPPGRLEVRPRRERLRFLAGTWRGDVPDAVSSSVVETIGPRLFEQTDYTLYLRSKTGEAVALEHRDPVLLRDLQASEGGRVVHGVINFGAYVGRSEFAVRVGGEPELDIEVEVFPTKLDYRSDYEQILADVQDILTGLVFEYLRSTYQPGSTRRVPHPTHVEWLTLLRHIADDLERALDHVARHPHRTLLREPRDVRIERVKRPDAALRRAVLRGSRAGPQVSIGNGLAVRERVFERQAQLTLDTPEHRWLAAQLTRIRRRLAWLGDQENRRPANVRRSKALREIEALKGRIARLGSLEPMVAAQGMPPPGFASMQLIGAPGYREAYRACMILSLGLHLDGGPLRLPLKDLNLLYEYWCFLAFLRLVAEETGQPIPVHQLLQVEQQGLRVLLQKGRQQTVVFEEQNGRKLTVSYNPRFHGDAYLVPQQPDLLVTLHEKDWPKVRLVLDAKYRVDASPEYVAQYGAPGPPDDAINVLHRYRDAIVEMDDATGGEKPKRTVVDCVAFYPYRETIQGQFIETRLWKALSRIGVGALPFLPDGDAYVVRWLRSVLQQGGWVIADRAIPYRATEQSLRWRAAAAEVVLIGTLRGGVEAEHLAWIQREGLYYLPMRKHQRRQFAVKWIAIYEPTALRKPGAITLCAEVLNVEVIPRRSIGTPWHPHGEPEDFQVLYHLDKVQPLPTAIVNRAEAGIGSAVRQPRWSSRLALLRSNRLQELLLETEAEWRLYEGLRAVGIAFDLRADVVNMPDPDSSTARVTFEANEARVQYRGRAGFRVMYAGQEIYLSRAEDVVEVMVLRRKY